MAVTEQALSRRAELEHRLNEVVDASGLSYIDLSKKAGFTGNVIYKMVHEHRKIEIEEAWRIADAAEREGQLFATPAREIAMYLLLVSDDLRMAPRPRVSPVQGSSGALTSDPDDSATGG